VMVMATAGGCAGGGEPDPDAGPRGRFSSPADFDRSDCVAGSLAGHPPVGIYHFTRWGVVGLWTSGWPGTARLDSQPGGNPSGTLYGHATTVTLADDDDLFWYAPSDDGHGSYSLDLCRAVGDTLSGTYVYCNANDCLDGPVTGVRLERMAEADAQGLRLRGEVDPPGPGETFDVAVDGDVAYLAKTIDGLAVVDVSDPTRPTVIGSAPVEYPEAREYYNDVRLHAAGGRRYALAASNVAGVVVWDVTTPSAPVRVLSFGLPGLDQTPPDVHTLYVDGTLLYLADLNRGLQIWDIADPLAPVPVYTPAAQLTQSSFVHDLYVAGGRAYLSSWDVGMVVLDVSAPATPAVVGVFRDYGESSSHSVWVTQVGNRRVAAHGDEQWRAHLRLIDVTEGTGGFATQLGEWRTRDEVSIHNLVAIGSEVFVAYYQDGVRIVDISDPTRPVQTAWFNTWPGYDRRYGDSYWEGALAIDVDPSHGRLYVADSHRGLLILDRTP